MSKTPGKIFNGSLIKTALIVLSFSFFGLSNPGSAFSAGFARGSDVGWLSQMESQGIKFYNNAGIQQDCLTILQGKCIDSIRLRVWVNPPAGWCNKADVVKMATRAAAMGLRIMIDFHYADSWADPGKQPIPAAWAGYTLAQLSQAVSLHTVDVLSALSAAGVHPEWVQVGNETNNGMLWPAGEVVVGTAAANFAPFAQLINSGYAAVKSVEPNAKVVIHISNGYDNNLFRWMFDGLKAAGANWDVIGMSLYPSTTNWTTLDTQCQANSNDMITRYGKPVVMSEVGMDVTDPTNSFAFLSDIIAKNSGLPGGNGLGVFYWEPESYNGWQGYNMGAFDNTGKPTHAMDAFSNGCSTSTPTGTPGATTPTPTATSTATRTATSTLTATRTNSPTPTPSATASKTASLTPTNTPTSSPSSTRTNTPTTTASSSSTSTPTRTASGTASPTPTNTTGNTATASLTSTATKSATPTMTSTPTDTLLDR